VCRRTASARSPRTCKPAAADPPRPACPRSAAISSPDAAARLGERLTTLGARSLAVEADLADPEAPGPLDTGWMTPELTAEIVSSTPLGRLGTPRDAAHLVGFLCSPEGGWINRQLLLSNGGLA
jgi:NAD(P)-dependent dehydrogenase (short-subunit alcohol dehydrogenase family)